MLPYFKEDYIVITAPTTKESSLPEGWTNEIYVHIGNVDALTLSNGHIYGEGLSKLMDVETERINIKNRLRNQYRSAEQKALTNGRVDKAETISVNNLFVVEISTTKRAQPRKDGKFYRRSLESYACGGKTLPHRYYSSREGE